jgi:hypothetical protein
LWELSLVLILSGEVKITQIIEEAWLKHETEKPIEDRKLLLDEVISTYKNLRAAYEFRRGNDQVNKFFIRQMEIKRKYREVQLKNLQSEDKRVVYKNNWFRRNFFTLFGWDHLLSNYGESLWRPITAGVMIILFLLFSLLLKVILIRNLSQIYFHP